MKQWIAGIILMTNTVFGQSNLVPNPSFEQCTHCITNDFGPASYQAAIVDWYNPNTCTPDYFTAIDYPSLLNYQPDGQAFIGIATYDPFGSSTREYASCTLLEQLTTSKWYEVSFYARVMDYRSRFASNNLGIHFSDTALHANNMLVFNYNTPPLLETQVKYFNNEIIQDTAHWTLVRSLYQAHGGEQFLTLGNFNTDAQTTQGMEYMDGGGWQTYFLIDMVSVIPLDSIPGGIPADAGPDTTIYINDTAFIGQKISNMPSVWQKLDGTPVASNTAGVYVSPQVTTTYVVSHTINGIYSADTVTVFVIDDLGVDELTDYSFTVSPNPNKGNFSLQMKQPLKENTELFIYDNMGRNVMKQGLELNSKEVLVTPTLNPGIYLLQLQQNGRFVKRQKMVIE